MSTIPFFLVTGFLGSGKTTFIKELLRTHGREKKILIVQNEFAPANIDGADLRRCGYPYRMLEINNGSVFCVCLLSEFATSLSACIDKERPDTVVLEASGLSDPIAIAQLLQDSRLRERVHLAHVWTIVDVGTFAAMAEAMTRVRHQVRVADVVVINKADRGIARCAAAKKLIRALNPFATIVQTSMCRIPISLETDYGSQPVAEALASRHQSLKPGKRPAMESAVLRSTKAIDRKRLDAFLLRCRDMACRLKGFVRLSDSSVVAVQQVFDVISIEPIDRYNGPTELIAMGSSIDSKDLLHTFETSLGSAI